MIPDPALLDRVRKLLALAGSPSAPEAAAALGRAQALITRHRLEGYLAAEAAVEADPDPITDGRDAPLEVARKTRKWKSVLASALADANGCVAYGWRSPDGDALCVIGRARDREVVRALWDALVPTLEWLSATEGPGRSRAWHEAFRIGAADVVADRLREGGDTAREGLGAQALTVVDARVVAHREALDAYAARVLGRGRGRGLLVDAKGLEAGRAAGARVKLPTR